MINGVLNEEWCIYLAVFTPTRSLFRACAVFHLATCFMRLEWKCTKSCCPQEIKGHVTPHSWVFQSQSNLSPSLELPSHGHSSNLHCNMGGCSKITGAQGHCVWILYLCTMLWIHWVISASWQCCCCGEKLGSSPCLVQPCKSFGAPRRVSSCFPTDRPCCALPLPQLCSSHPADSLRKGESAAEAKLRK